jgi:hypothetical protein
MTGVKDIRIEKSFLRRGATIACLREEGKMPVFEERLRKSQMIGAK